MKALSISGFLLGIICLITAAYLQFILEPAARSLEASIENGTPDDVTGLLYIAAHEAKVNTGINLVILGGLGFLLSLIASFKTKNKLAMAGMILSFLGLLAGLVHGTHLFS